MLTCTILLIHAHCFFFRTSGDHSTYIPAHQSYNVSMLAAMHSAEMQQDVSTLMNYAERTNMEMMFSNRTSCYQTEKITTVKYPGLERVLMGERKVTSIERVPVGERKVTSIERVPMGERKVTTIERVPMGERKVTSIELDRKVMTPYSHLGTFHFSKTSSVTSTTECPRTECTLVTCMENTKLDDGLMDKTQLQ